MSGLEGISFSTRGKAMTDRRLAQSTSGPRLPEDTLTTAVKSVHPSSEDG